MCYARRQRSSWARIKLSKSFYLISGLPELKSYFELFILASFTLLSIYNSIDEISIFALTILLCTYLLLFNFQWPMPSLRDSLSILPHSFALVNTFFESFLSFFNFFSKPSRLCPFGQLVHFTTLFPFCQHLFLNFFLFVCFYKQNNSDTYFI